MDSIINFFRDVLAMLPTIKFMDIIDILLVTFVLYTLIMMIQTTGAARIVKSIVLMLALAVVTKLLNMYLMSFLLDRVLEIGLIALVIMFQPELRRMLEKIGSKSFREMLSTKQEQREIDRVIDETVKACEIMSRERTGVLIVFERETSLIDYQKTGTVIDARVSSAAQPFLHQCLAARRRGHHPQRADRGGRLRAPTDAEQQHQQRPRHAASRRYRHERGLRRGGRDRLGGDGHDLRRRQRDAQAPPRAADARAPAAQGACAEARGKDL